ncbi:transcription-repair coupling factor [[Clostridium] leptum]|nr:transcription-repair coupling factor [[Clostridium] leptum]
MTFLTNALKGLPEFDTVAGCIRAGRAPMAVSGLSGIQKAHFVYALGQMLERPAIVLAGDESECAQLQRDLEAMEARVLLYPARDLTFQKLEGISREYEHTRLQVLYALQNGQCDVVLTTPDAAMLYTIPPALLQERTVRLRSGQRIPLKQMAAALVDAGYVRADQVDGIGQFSIRGGICDFYAPGTSAPTRVEMWDDEIDTLLSFDPETQRRTEQLEEAVITPAVEILPPPDDQLSEGIRRLQKGLRGAKHQAALNHLSEDLDRLEGGGRLHALDKYLPLIYPQRASLFDYIRDGMLFVSDPVKVKERAHSFHWQMGEDIKSMLEEGILCKGITEFSLPGEQMPGIYEQYRAVYLDAFTRAGYETPLRHLISVNTRQLSVWAGGLDLLKEDIEPMLDRNWAVAVLAGTEKSADNLCRNLRELGLPAVYVERCEMLIPGQITILPGSLSAGMEYPGAKVGILTQGQIAAVRKRKVRHKAGDALTSLSDLSIGDYVVHATHGIGLFEGIHKMDVHGVVKDYIKIRYDKGDILYVPVTQLDLVSKYIGPKEDSKVKLHRLGGTEWQKARSRVRKAVKDMAKQLIKLYAERMKVEGFACGPDTDWQSDFERRFAYEETEDQLRCVDEIKADMERSFPMDRLLCGDVGFGKTEVALRGAFKCIDNGRQCALLVPTTILAWQHYQTILTRFEGFPIKVEVLSRYRTPKQQAAILNKLRRGEIDMIVGTHRLVQKDVQFKNLGLVIVDEEQRFGVAQKEKLKELFPGVDCLTLSATPIPRTLNMAMSGVRDMSVIEEAPQDRHPVQTYVVEYDPAVLDEAIRRELRRGGQVYYLHNRVESIEQTAYRISQRIPGAKVGVAHGKMTEEALSDVWEQLLGNEINVLVCTTIIETGVDIPNCNTLIIENADRMGLAQLHQLRGRVGRSSRRAYAYLTFAGGKVLSEISTKRLAAIREFTEFGSGFKIAMRDLEIRGAGNILGAEQHGHMEAVGYDMYLRLLSEAVDEEKGEKTTRREAECLVDVQIGAHIPEQYIPSSAQRLDIYRRIADIRTQEDVSDVLDELIDRFGDVPDAVAGLVEVSLLRNMAADLGISEISQKNDRLLFYIHTPDLERTSRLMANMKGRVMLSAGQKPYIQVKMLPGQSPLACMRETLEGMADVKEEKRSK